MSSTCAKEGKRPALLARFRELLQVARRVVVADADLDNATLTYLRDLRAKDPENQGTEVKAEPIFLIRNDFQGKGYPCEFLDAPDRTEITAQILEAVAAASPSQVTFVATDSKGISKIIAAAVAKVDPNKKVLVINSETSGGEIERDFMQSPDRALLEGCFDVVIVSPSMATGVSIEAKGVVSKVFGIFTGASSNDADISQALSRVREPVERIVWCACAGSNYSKVSRSAIASEVKLHLQASTAATVRLVRSNLREDVAGAFDSYSFSANPHLDLFCRLSAEQNRAMFMLRDALLVRLKVEGNQVSIKYKESNSEIKLFLSELRGEQELQEAENLVAADDLEYADLLLLEQKEALSPEEQRAVAKHYMKEFYCLETLSVDDVLWDKQGQRRSELLNFEVQIERELSLDRTVKAIEKQAAWGKGVCPWDTSTIELKRALRERLGLNELIKHIETDREWTKYDLQAIADTAREFLDEIKIVLGYSVQNVSDVQVVHHFLRQLGIRANKKPRWSRSVEGHEGEKIKVFSLNESHWNKVQEVLERRKEKRESLRDEVLAVGSPPCEKVSTGGGDPIQDSQIAVYTELLLEGYNFGHEALLELYGGLPEELKESVLMRLPSVLHSILSKGLYQPKLRQVSV